MNISPHLIIDAVILSTALTITLLLRTKGNTARKEKETKWLLEKKKNSINLDYIKFGYGESIARIMCNKNWKLAYLSTRIKHSMITPYGFILG